MVTVRIGDLGDVELQGGALSPVLWHHAFGTDDMMAVVRGVLDALRQDPPQYRLNDVARLAYVLAATADAASRRSTLPFRAWLLSAGEVDFGALAVAVCGEAAAGCFRAG